MHEFVDRLAGSAVSVDRELEREFEVRLRDTATLAFRVAYSVLRQREDAEDVAQDAFAKAHRSFHQLRDRARFRAWIVRMTWRLSIDRRRTDRRRELREAAPIVPPSEPSAEQTIEQQQRADALWQAIDRLPEKLRMVTVLAAIEGHDLAAVATLLRVPVGTVKSRLSHARQHLREELQWIR